jgi:sec-independent protein translocase protein TatB
MARLMVILAVALIILGPRDLPRLARTLGRAMQELRRASEDFATSIRAELEILEREEASRSEDA